MMEREHRHDAVLFTLRNKIGVPIECRLIPLTFCGFIAGPLDRKSVTGHAEFSGEFNILRKTIPMIRGCARFCAAFDVSLSFEIPPVVLIVVAFNLMTTGGNTPLKFAHFRMNRIFDLIASECAGHNLSSLQNSPRLYLEPTSSPVYRII